MNFLVTFLGRGLMNNPKKRAFQCRSLYCSQGFWPRLISILRMRIAETLASLLREWRKLVTRNYCWFSQLLEGKQHFKGSWFQIRALFAADKCIYFQWTFCSSHTDIKSTSYRLHKMNLSLSSEIIEES